MLVRAANHHTLLSSMHASSTDKGKVTHDGDLLQDVLLEQGDVASEKGDSGSGADTPDRQSRSEGEDSSVMCNRVSVGVDVYEEA
jgi:hypothetical protein